MAALGPADPPDDYPEGGNPHEDDVRLDVADMYYLDLYRRALEEIAHGKETPCFDDTAELRCPGCLAREVLSS